MTHLVPQVWYWLIPEKPDDQVDSPDFVYILAESLLPVDYTLAHQAGRVITNVAFQQQKFNPLFTLVFTQIIAMEFTVFGNTLSNSRVTLSKLKAKFFQCDSILAMLLRIFPNTVNFIAVIWVKTNVNRGLNFCSWNATLEMTLPAWCAKVSRQPPHSRRLETLRRTQPKLPSEKGHDENIFSGSKIWVSYCNTNSSNHHRINALFYQFWRRSGVW